VQREIEKTGEVSSIKYRVSRIRQDRRQETGEEKKYPQAGAWGLNVNANLAVIRVLGLGGSCRRELLGRSAVFVSAAA